MSLALLCCRLLVYQEDADLGILVLDAVKRPTQQVFNVVRAIAPKPCLARYGFRHSGELHLLAQCDSSARDCWIAMIVRMIAAYGHFGHSYFHGVSSLTPEVCCLRIAEENEVSKWAGGSQTESDIAANCRPSLDEMRAAGIAGGLRHRLASGGEPDELDGGSSLIPIILCLNKVHLPAEVWGRVLISNLDPWKA